MVHEKKREYEPKPEKSYLAPGLMPGIEFKNTTRHHDFDLSEGMAKPSYMNEEEDARAELAETLIGAEKR